MMRNIGLGLAVAIVLVVVVALLVVRTTRFQEYVRRKIIAAIVSGTGGTTEIGSLALDLPHMHARIMNLVIHGSEPANAAPFVRVAQVDVNARLFSGGHIVGITYLGIQRPEVNVMVFPDGHTNLPTPKPSAPTNTTPLATIVDLAVGHFVLSGGELTYNSQKQPLDLRADNLQVQLWYHMLHQDYEGRLALDPVYAVSGRQTPVTYRISLPMVLHRDQIILNGASIVTSASTLQIDAAMNNMWQPAFSGHIRGRIALADLQNTFGLKLDIRRRGVPDAVQLDADAAMAAGSIDVKALRATLGQSTIQASGVLKGSPGAAPLQFQGRLALPELARLLGVNARPQGTVSLGGQATLSAGNQYRVSGNISSHGLGVDQGTLHLHNIELSTAVSLTPAHVELSQLRLAALGGEIFGKASLEDFAHYTFDGSLRHLNLVALAELAQQRIPYSGVISGPIAASGDLNAPGMQSISVSTRLAIVPDGRGIPMRGRLSADYDGIDDALRFADSYIALPHTKLTLAGSTQSRINVSLTTRDLDDLLAAAPGFESPAIALDGGQASFTGAIAGKLSAPRISGHLAINRFMVEGRQFDSLTADAATSPAGASVAHGSLARGKMTASFTGSVGLHAWKTDPRAPISADVQLQNGDLADIMVLAGQPNQDYTGALSAMAHITGTLGNPNGSATLNAANGTIYGEPFDRMDARVSFTDRLAVLQSASLAAGNAHVDLTGEFQHPRDSFTTGAVRARISTSQIDLAQLRTLQRRGPNTAGQVQLTAEIAGYLSSSEFLVSSVQADAAARALHFEGQAYGNFQGVVRTNGDTASFKATSDFAGSNLRASGTVQLVRGYPGSADVQLSGLPVERVLAIAHRQDIPVKGQLTLSAHAHGSLENPEGNATISLTHAVVSGEPLDTAGARINYLPKHIDVSSAEVTAGPSHVALTASFDHPAGRFDTGDLQFRIENSHIDLAHLRSLQNARPGLAGMVQFSADGSAKLGTGSPTVLLTSLNANADAQDVASNGQNLGGFTLAAHTTAGNRLDFSLNSNLAGAAIEVHGNGQLGAGYPIDAQLSFSNVKWSRLSPLLGGGSEAASFEMTTQGKASISGPLIETDQLRGSLQISQFQVQTLPQAGARRPLTIQNQGPVQMTLDRGLVRVDSFHLTGPQTDIQASGTVVVQTQAMNVSVNAGVDLGILQNFSRDIVSSGTVKLAAKIRGGMSDPQATGSLQLSKAAVNYSGMPIGLSNANGLVTLAGNRASIHNLTAEVGGGKVVLNGFAGIGGGFRFDLKADAANIRVPVQEGVSMVGNAQLQGAGTMASSTLTGRVTLTQLNYAPRSDLGSILTRAVPSVESSASPQPLLDNMKLDVRVVTSSAMRVQASLAENLQTDANLQVRGTASLPSVLGRVNLTGGQLVFFGSTYTVNSGSISFFNPVRIEPILNLSLETQSQGVDVVLNVTGPVDNMKLTYTSDPPLEFEEIAALLSTGTTPTTNPNILANEPTPPPQTFEQRGESAILGQAIADPVASRLQRVFGITQLQISPTVAGSSTLPTAQVTLQQQVSSNITFTYISALDNPNSTLISAQWALNRRWSAQAVRDQNGIFSINLFYKRQFR
jgi:translocation and assembly module TamB